MSFQGWAYLVELKKFSDFQIMYIVAISFLYLVTDRLYSYCTTVHPICDVTTVAVHPICDVTTVAVHPICDVTSDKTF